jgi:hypothetical protein
MSDWFLRRLHQKRGHSCPADRLWLSYIAFATIIAGLLTWGFQLQHATTWNVTPCVGAGIASFGNQMQTTILTTFAVESKKERAAEVGIFVNICRQIYGFVSSFGNQSMEDQLLTWNSFSLVLFISQTCSPLWDLEELQA